MRPRICVNIIQFVNLTSSPRYVPCGSLNSRMSAIFECLVLSEEDALINLSKCARLHHVKKFRRINEYAIVSIILRRENKALFCSYKILLFEHLKNFFLNFIFQFFRFRVFSLCYIDVPNYRLITASLIKLSAKKYSILKK